MSQLNYEDFLNRISIQDVLRDAGYQLNRRDGLRYPSYIKIDSNGRKIQGDKFIVTGNGKCCFQPPTQKNFNVIGFIKEHAQLFSEYHAGISQDRLVNLVCNRLLNNPIQEFSSVNIKREQRQSHFNLKEYDIQQFQLGNFESQKAFYPYFKYRGINLDTQRSFSNHFFIANRKSINGKSYSNLSFPFRKPSDLITIVGLEERSRANAEGKTFYKGMALGTNATDGLWIASPEATPLKRAKDVYWFESAYDAMSFYQLRREQLEKIIECNIDGKGNGWYEREQAEKELRMLSRSVFVSTGGNPSMNQYRGMLTQTPRATQHLCFDRDVAGQMFAINFALNRADSNYTLQADNEDKLKLVNTKLSNPPLEYSLNNFDFNQILKDIGIENRTSIHPMTEYMGSLTNEKDIFSGDEMELPTELGKLYGRYESNVEEYLSAKQSGLVCNEDLKDLADEMLQSHTIYEEGVNKAVDEYMDATKNGAIIYEPCEKEYKDWNEQLLDKRQVAKENGTEVGLGLKIIENTITPEEESVTPRYHR